MPDQITETHQDDGSKLYSSAVSVPKLAERLGVGQTTAWAWVRQNKIQSVKLGRRVLVPEWAIYEFLQNAPSGSRVEV